MQRINLYHGSFRRRRDPLDARHMALYLAIGLAVLAAVSVIQSQRLDRLRTRVATLQAQRQAVTARLERLRGQADATPDADHRLARLRAELAAKRRLLAYLEPGDLDAGEPEARGFSPFLAGLAERSVEGVWFSAITLHDGGKRLRLAGHAVAAGRVPRLIATLAEIPAFAGHGFKRLAIDRPDDAGWRVDFVLASRPAAADNQGGSP